MVEFYIFKLFSSGQLDWIYRPYLATFNDSQLGEQAKALKDELILEGRNEGWEVFSTASRPLYWSGVLLYGYRREHADRYIFLAKKFQFKLGLDPSAYQKRFNPTKGIMRKVGDKKRRQLLQEALPCIQPVETDENHLKR